MTFLLRLRKVDLLELARELGLEVNGDLIKVENKDVILQSDKNDIETIKVVMEGVLEEKEKDGKEREFEERSQIREYELERLRLSNATDTVSVSSADLEGQAKKEKVSDNRWVSHLIPLLPAESIELFSKESPERGNDYPHIKKLLLNRFQLTPVAFRDRFESHQRRPGF
ncbi:uncharacterized protein TNCV_3265261 [Trichonephila clavipes]|nr:uncharacterized protein TNCV_3265261 [Trichonephila clavipes]